MKLQPKDSFNFIFAGGGTGGHLFPLVAVAEQIKLNLPNSNIIFAGTKNKIESRVIPSLGYNFIPFSISGMPRKISFKFITFIFKLFFSLIKALIFCIKYKPHVAIGSGAYVSGPVIWAAKITGAKIVLLEQNSFPGITNRLLEKKADKIYISFEDSKKYFRCKDKLYLYGNPLRINITKSDKNSAKLLFGLNNANSTLVILGGSLGAKTINNAIEKYIEKLTENNINIIWQCGSNYYDNYKKYDNKTVKVFAFINNMGEVYSAADLIIARAGATTIAEAAYLGLPVIFIPSPNVTDNHQYKNAKSLEDKGGAIVVKDDEAEDKIYSIIIDTINNKLKLNDLSENIKNFAGLDSAIKISSEIIDLAKNKHRL
ncbi:MAG TPA: undecaprenyldiphospho-muramoylpentapeptide beta-N-acetylglucosaminyltransferase [Melioribacteraceae bacterium]|nr:undecaprenyldiphospho-muramoylpentapeptide beta-N-acetylglucosaminyltransferase [Melioribacteraceae bacterium]